MSLATFACPFAVENVVQLDFCVFQATPSTVLVGEILTQAWQILLVPQVSFTILSKGDAQDSEFCSFFGRIEDDIN